MPLPPSMASNCQLVRDFPVSMDHDGTNGLSRRRRRSLRIRSRWSRRNLFRNTPPEPPEGDPMTVPSFETLAYEVREGIATITLNRPDRLNAFTVQMREDLRAAFDATDADDAVGAVIVTGAGRAFC